MRGETMETYGKDVRKRGERRVQKNKRQMRAPRESGE